MKQNIIYHYGVPRELITDNGKKLNWKMIEQLFQQFKIEHRILVPYCPQMNGVVEFANKNIKKILVKMIDTYKDWHEFLPFALCTNRVSMGATPYSLVHDMEAVLLVEVEIPSFRILSQTKLSEDEWACS